MNILSPKQLQHGSPSVVCKYTIGWQSVTYYNINQCDLVLDLLPQLQKKTCLEHIFYTKLARIINMV